MKTYKADVGCWDCGKIITILATSDREAFTKASQRTKEALPLCKQENPGVVQIYEEKRLVWDFAGGFYDKAVVSATTTEAALAIAQKDIADMVQQLGVESKKNKRLQRKCDNARKRAIAFRSKS